MQMKKIHATLIFTALVAGVFAFFASNSRITVASDAVPSFFFYRFPAYHDAILNLSSGYVISVLFYFLIVYLPSRARINRIKGRALKAYSSFRRSLIQNILSAIDGTDDPDLVDRLTDPDEFDRYMREDVTGTGDRWCDFMNGLSQFYAGQIILDLEFLKDEIIQIIGNVEIEDEEVFTILKNLTKTIQAMTRLGTEYDEQTVWARFLRSIISPTEPSTSNRIDDPILNAIQRIK